MANQNATLSMEWDGSKLKIVAEHQPGDPHETVNCKGGVLSALQGAVAWANSQGISPEVEMRGIEIQQ